tara:strand:- start:20438 stop:23563 length:3126 start_codon:yes stop_codon:yes gene_type:complete
MGKKKKTLSDAINEIKDDVQIHDTGYNIPDIITFCEHKDWLALPHSSTNPVNLYPMQKIMLKAFYRGSPGNENLKLTDEEIERCINLGLVDDAKGDVIGKYESGEMFNELVLVWGRRSGKDFLVSIIALYEAMKLLEIPGGDPYAYYEIAADNTINILTIANSKTQAAIAFDAIKSKLFTSKYFKDKFMSDGLTQDSIFLLTPKNKKDNKERKEKGLPLHTGSIGILVGHSNSDTLLGKGCMVLLLDEVASYKATGGSSSGDRIYTALTPTVRTYFRRTYETDGEGNFVTDDRGIKIIKDRFYDGKVISISSPRAQEGKFYELFKTTKDNPGRLTCRLATWDVNIHHTRESLRKSETSMSESEFMMEYGAEFSGAAMEYFFTEDQVDSCFNDHPFKLRDMGEPGKVYFAHFDPARSSHNYAVVVLHKEFYLNQETEKTDYIIVVDHIKFWEPGLGKPIDVNLVDDYIVNLKRRFHIGMMTYDQMTSLESVMKLRKAGIPNKLTPFNHLYKNQIYKEFENAVNGFKLKIPFHQHLKQEMLELQRKFVAQGFRVSPKKDGDGVKTDDICVSPKTVVYTNSGGNFIEDVKIGDEILTHNGRYKTISGFSKHKPNDNMIKIQPFYSLPLICTKNHPLEVIDNNGDRIWKRAEYISFDDRLVKSFPTEEIKFEFDLLNYIDKKVNKHSNISSYIEKDKVRMKNANGKWHNRKISSTTEFGYVCGYFLAEGSLGDHGICFASNINETDIHEHFEHCLVSNFDIKSSGVSSQKNSLGCQINVNSVILKRLFYDMFRGNRSYKKVIPLNMITAPYSFQKALIKGIFDGDGCSDGNRIIFSTTSKILAYQIQLILLRLKIASSVTVSKRKGKTTFIRNRKVRHHSDLYNVVVTYFDSYNKLSDILELGHNKKASKFHKPNYEFFDNFVTYKIYNIEDIESYKDDVVNISVEDDSSYVSEGVNSHNCDCIAGAIYIAVNKYANKLPMGKTVEMGNVLSANNRVWRSMSGVLGYGTGQQVAAALDRNASWREVQRDIERRNGAAKFGPYQGR